MAARFSFIPTRSSPSARWRANVRLLVAGIGNIFFGDDGFGSEVARALAESPIEDVKIEDFGIRGMHLAFELLAGYERAFLIDAVPRGGRARNALRDRARRRAAKRRCRTRTAWIYRTSLPSFGRSGVSRRRSPLVGCEPSVAGEQIGLSDAVSAAVPPAVELVRRLVGEALCESASRQERKTLWTEV